MVNLVESNPGYATENTNGVEVRNGVKGASPLPLVKHFNIVDGFVVDYMQ
jgi:hypothetical protein